MLDLPGCVTSSVVQYADGTAICRAICNEKDFEALRNVLKAIYPLFHLNNMKLNLIKNIHLTITRDNNILTHNYMICATNIKKGNHLKLLGVHITVILKWKWHTDIVFSKANRLLGLIARTFKGGKIKLSKVLCVSCVRSVLLYGTPA
jgi:hypothetical protein